METQNRTSVRNERDSNRILLLFYDIVALILVWVATMVLHPSLAYSIPLPVLIANLLLAGVCFIVGRMFFRVYRQILRTGTVRPFALELVGTITGGIAYILICRFVRFFYVVFTTNVTFAVSYILVSLLIRITYFYLYQLAQRDNRFSGWLKAVLIHLTLVDFDSEREGALLRVVLEPSVRSVTPINEMQSVVRQFAIRGEATSITPITRGYINQTYRVETLSDAGHVHKYLLQRINTNVFPDPDALMENVKLTADFLHGRLLLPGHTKTGSVQMIRPAKDGRAYLRCDSGCWRMMTYFDGVYSLDIPDSPRTFYLAGQAFGNFLREMSAMDIEDIHTVIPNFHNTRSRYEDLEKVIAKDPVGRLKEVGPEVAFVRARVGCYGLITDALESGSIPTRICHNDCNLNNILFDKQTHLPVAIIDLDTVMPSSALYDYGDSMRIGTNTATDDEKDLTKVSCDLNLYEQYARGWLEACGDMLTENELKLLPYASLVITSEDGIRFLMDHIDGDTYYNIFYAGQNLDRSRTQLKLVADMELKLPSIVAILQRIYDELHLNVTLDEKEIVEKWQPKSA